MKRMTRETKTKKQKGQEEQQEMISVMAAEKHALIPWVKSITLNDNVLD